MLTGGSLFSGAGLLDSGLHLAGIDHRWLCEWDPWRRARLEQRFPDARVYDDVRGIGLRNAETVDLIAGGFPCKGASSAGPRNGFDHPETVLWREMRRAIGELEPRYVLIENVANLLALHDGAVWGEVLSDLAALGFDVVWDCLPAAAVGAPHLRDRVFAVATHAHRLARTPWIPRDRTGEPVDGPGSLERAERLHGLPAAADPDEPRTDAHAATGPSRTPTGAGGCAAADTALEGLQREGLRGQPADRSSIDWGIYEPAIRRWRLAGAAPEPLVRGLDDGDPAVHRLRRRVDRSRLSALGDGVQVQVGYLAGAYIVDLERARLAGRELAA